MVTEQRTVVWFSAGAASAAAAFISLHQYPNVVLAYIDPGSEHPDNQRFLADFERWVGHPVTRLKSEKYKDTWDVFLRDRYLVGPTGARCTGQLKKAVRHRFERPDDRHVFGYTYEEKHRAGRFREQNPGVELLTPLIDWMMRKKDCLRLVANAGIELPIMYQLGYNNNNCIGCVKGGMGYWNKIRVDFPDAFERMAQTEETLGNYILKDKDGPVPLRQLDPRRGRHRDLEIDCSIDCPTGGL